MLENDGKRNFMFRDGLLAKLGLSLLVELMSDFLFALVSPSSGKGDTKKEIFWYIFLETT